MSIETRLDRLERRRGKPGQVVEVWNLCGGRYVLPSEGLELDAAAFEARKAGLGDDVLVVIVEYVPMAPTEG